MSFLENEENPFSSKNLTPNIEASIGSPDANCIYFWGIILNSNITFMQQQRLYKGVTVIIFLSQSPDAESIKFSKYIVT